MPGSLNKAQIIGNLTRDPELRYTPSGQSVCNFGVATNRRFKNAAGQLQEDTQFHDVVAWGKQAETIAQYVKKGNKIYIEGRLQTRSWDAPDGSKRYRTEIVTENFVFLTPKGEVSGVDEPLSHVEPRAEPAEVKGDQPSEKKAKKTAVKSTATPDDETSSESKNAATDQAEEEINLDDIPF